MPDLRLFCLIEDQPIEWSFSITISSGKTIEDLKESICKKEKLPTKLSLFKVSITNDRDLKNLNIEKSKLLFPMAPISNYFQPVTGYHIQVFVRKPIQIASVQDPSNVSTRPSEKYSRLHCLLWKKEAELRKVIFVKNTVAVPLQTEKPQKWTSMILTLDAAISRYLEKNSTENRDDWKDLLPCKSNSLLYREAYREILEQEIACEKANGFSRRDGATVTNHTRKSFQKGGIFTGQPGIGKTWFLSLALVDRLLHGEPTIFQLGDGQTFLFDENGAIFISKAVAKTQRFKSASDNVEVWALTDQTPRDIVGKFDNHQWYILLTSSPKPENFKTFHKACSAALFYMQVWSWSEIVMACHIKNIKSRCLIDLFKLYNEYGPIPRLLLDVFVPIGEKNQSSLNNYNQQIKEKLITILQGGYSTLQEQFDSRSSHTIILLEPKFDDSITTKHISSLYNKRFMTAKIAFRLGLLASSNAHSKGKEVYDWMLYSTYFKSAAGWVFRGRAHGVFMAGVNHLCKVLTAPEDLKNLYTTGRFHSIIGSRPALKKALGSELADFQLKLAPKSQKTFSSIQNLSGNIRFKKTQRFNGKFDKIYWIPEQRNLGAFDAVAISVDYGKPRAIFFQHTVSMSHQISGRSASQIWTALPKEIRNMPPIIVFVVPLKNAKEFKVQSVNKEAVDITKCDPSIWPQYVLGLDDNILWFQNHRSDSPMFDT